MSLDRSLGFLWLAGSEAWLLGSKGCKGMRIGMHKGLGGIFNEGSTLADELTQKFKCFILPHPLVICHSPPQRVCLVRCRWHKFQMQK